MLCGSVAHEHTVWHADFFFQADDGIRDRNVTGVQTCDLPISSMYAASGVGLAAPQIGLNLRLAVIGRASCRERVEILVVAVSLKKKDVMISRDGERKRIVGEDDVEEKS